MSAIIPLPGAQRLPELYICDGERFARKSELHVTVVNTREQYGHVPLRAAAVGLDFRVKPTGLYRRLRQGAKRSLIELVEVLEQEEYCTRLEVAMGLPPQTVPRLPSHITLFTEPGGLGIGLHSTAELEALSSPVDLKLEPSPWQLGRDGVILGA